MTLSIMLFFFLAILDVTSALENNLHGHQIESDAVLLRDQTNQSTNNHPQQNKLQLLVPQSIPNDEPETANNRKLLDDATKIFKNGELRGSGRRKKQPSKQRRSDVDLDGGISERTSKMNTISILINEVAEDTTRKLEDGLGFGFDYSDDKPQPEIGSASSPPGVGGSGAAGGATNPGYGNYGGYGGGGEYGGAGGGANYGGYGAGGAGGGDYDTGNAGSYGGSSGAAGGYGGGANTAGGVPSTSGYGSYGGAPSANSMDSSGSAAAGGGYGDYGSYGGYGAPSSSSNYGDSYSDSWGAGSASSSFKSKIRIKMKNPFSSKISLLPALFLFFMIALAGMLITAHQMERFPEGTFANCCRVSLGTVTCVYGVIYNLYHCRLGESVVFSRHVS